MGSDPRRAPGRQLMHATNNGLQIFHANTANDTPLEGEVIEMDADLIKPPHLLSGPAALTPENLKNDAIRRNFRPGMSAVTNAGRLVFITSWPWMESHPLIKARTQQNDPMTNTEFLYFDLVRAFAPFDL